MIGKTPKSLLEVGGRPLIERNIDYMLAAGLERIVIVVGYEKDRFGYLVERYEGRVVLVENPDYATSNTVTSLWRARHFFDTDSYITTADILSRENVFLKHTGNYCFYVLRPDAEYEKPDWIAALDEGMRFRSVDVRGMGGHAYTGISHWTVEGLAFIRSLMEGLDWADPDVHNMYWDELLLPHLDEFDLRAQIIESNDLLYEFDDMSDIALFEREQGSTVQHSK